MCLVGRWVLPGLLTLLIALVTAWATLVPLKEHDLAARLRDRLGARYPWSDISVDGRDVRITGVASGTDERDAALALVAGDPNVRRVVDGTAVLPIASPFVFSAVKAGDALTLEGAVPPSAHDAVLARARWLTGRVDDRLVESAGAEADFAERALAGLDRLAGLSEGRLDIRDREAVLSGTARDPQAYADLAGPDGTSAPTVQPPAVRPFGFSGEWLEDRIRLAGNVLDAQARSRLARLAGASLQRRDVDTRDLLIATGAPEGFAAAAELVARQLPRLAGGRVALTDRAARISGVPRSVAGETALLADLDRLRALGITVDTSLAPVVRTVADASTVGAHGDVSVVGASLVSDIPVLVAPAIVAGVSVARPTPGASGVVRGEQGSAAIPLVAGLRGGASSGVPTGTVPWIVEGRAEGSPIRAAAPTVGRSGAPALSLGGTAGPPVAIDAAGMDAWKEGVATGDRSASSVPPLPSGPPQAHAFQPLGAEPDLQTRASGRVGADRWAPFPVATGTAPATGDAVAVGVSERPVAAAPLDLATGSGRPRAGRAPEAMDGGKTASPATGGATHLATVAPRAAGPDGGGLAPDCKGPIATPPPVRFTIAKAYVGDADRRRLDSFAQSLDACPGAIVRIVGSADPRGPREFNRRLSRLRAEAVARILVAAGIAPARLDIGAVGAVAVSGGDADHADARRVEVRADPSAAFVVVPR